ncbi:pectinesterase-like [Apium graveolens]|uniref:pectinesterase-like n=1 Tax=Apium graveolens TaxID=4045 RepID=UPI003D7B20D9
MASAPLLSTFLFIHLLVFVPATIVHGATPSIRMVDSNKINQDKITQRNLVISAAMAEVIQLHHLISSMDTSSFEDRVKSALADCLKLYENSIQQLNRSLSLSNTKKDNVHVHTLLSSALTDYQTCQNGFEDFDLFTTYSKLFPSNNFSKHICHSLSINKDVTGLQMSSLSGKISEGWPEWLSASDRRFLQAEVPAADLVVAQDGSGNFRTISEALAAAKTGSNRFVIHVKKGVYKEYVEIGENLRNLMLVGDGIDATVVTGSKSVRGSPGNITTFRTATFGADGSGLIVRDMTFENTAGPENFQAVAMRSDSDHSVFYRCSFKGYQDTLYVHSNSQFYRDCDIYGTIDFIFGNAIAVLQNCNIYVRKPLMQQFNTITAQGRKCPDDTTGFVLHNCSIKAASDLKPVQSMFKTYLGRPWESCSATVVMKSYMEDLIDPSGWVEWPGHPEYINTLYYGEYMNSGNGSSTASRVKWPGYHIITSAAEAQKFTVQNFLNKDSWLNATGVPFTPGLQ